MPWPMVNAILPSCSTSRWRATCGGLRLCCLPLGVLALPDSRHAQKKELKLFDLAGERVILSDASLTLGAWVEEAFSRSLVDLTPRARTNSIGLMIDLAKRDLGTVLQTRVGIEQEIADGTLTFVPLRDRQDQSAQADAAVALGEGNVGRGLGDGQACWRSRLDAIGRSNDDESCCVWRITSIENKTLFGTSGSLSP